MVTRRKKNGKAKAATAQAGSSPVTAPRAPAWRLVNRQQLAELMGVHPDTVTDFARAGMPVVTRGGHGQEGVYDSVVCCAWHRQQLGKNAKEAAQTRAYDASAKLNELKLERERGLLVSRDAIVLEGQGYVKAWSAMIRGLARRFVRAGVISKEQERPVAAECLDLLREVSTFTVANGKEKTSAAA